MFLPLVQRILGNADERFIKKLSGLVQEINALEATLSPLSDAELQAQTQVLKQRLAEGARLDDIVAPAFATVREAAKRVLGERHYDVQLIGGLILHRGMIAEMKTGEGKTLVSTLPIYLNALSGKGVHAVTVNDYLAKRDADWMGQVYRFLGLSVGCIHHELDDNQRRAAYACDITYATNNELGFDYLRDNMKFDKADLVMRGFHHAIIDEVDSILIDEARTPLIISGPAEDSTELYVAANALIPQLLPEHYEKDEKHKNVTFTESGNHRIEELLQQTRLIEGSLYDVHNISLVHHVNQALKAHKSFTLDVDYIVKDRKVMIIDEFTGRLMDGRRFSDGLHQALEAKEGVPIERENQTLASITYQNYFRMYDKLSGMTGTGKTEESEFTDIYNLGVIAVPTNRPVSRKDFDDEVYRSAGEKYDAIVTLVKECQARQQPVLVGTVSIEKSELLGKIFRKAGINHHVLNARFHEQEAQIIAQAGAPGAVTIATNMAGRGTDIKLGGNLEMMLEQRLPAAKTPEEREKLTQDITRKVAQDKETVMTAGGLYIMGTERHESRRIDNQLRGRAGRQGDPGASKFFLSLEDDLMRIFGSDRLDAMLQKLGLQPGEAITHRWVNRALERAQHKVEAQNFDMRKHLLKYDDVMNDQRKVIYNLRQDLMETQDAREIVSDMRTDLIETLVTQTMPPGSYPDQWQLDTMHEEMQRLFALDLPITVWAAKEGVAEAEMRQHLCDAVEQHCAKKEQDYGPELMRMAEKSLMLRILDTTWKDHLHALDHLRDGINLRAYAQRDPLNEYKSEAFSMFEQMLNTLRENVTIMLSRFTLGEGLTPQELRMQALGAFDDADGFDDDEVYEDPAPEALQPQPQPAPQSKSKRAKNPEPHAASEVPSTTVRRNDPCPCGSGQRFKHCHGALN